MYMGNNKIWKISYKELLYIILEETKRRDYENKQEIRSCINRFRFSGQCA